MVYHAECPSGGVMIRIDLWEWILHPNDLLLSLSPDSVMFVNVNAVASSLAQVYLTDIAGMNQEAEIRMIPVTK